MVTDDYDDLAFEEGTIIEDYSDGVPEIVGKGDESRKIMPPPVGERCILVEEEVTRPNRKAAS